MSDFTGGLPFVRGDNPIGEEFLTGFGRGERGFVGERDTRAAVTGGKPLTKGEIPAMNAAYVLRSTSPGTPGKIKSSTP
jgi:hypothetical protein